MPNGPEMFHANGGKFQFGWRHSRLDQALRGASLERALLAPFASDDARLMERIAVASRGWKMIPSTYRGILPSVPY